MSITPTVLHSVQLRSISKDHEGGHEDRTSSKLKCPTVNLTSTLSSSKSVDLKSPLLYNSHQHRSSKGSCESMFTSNEELAVGEAACQSEMRKEQGREAPSENVTAFSLQSELPSLDPPGRTTTHAGDPCRESVETSDCSSQPEPSQQQRTEPTDEEEEPWQIKPSPPLSVQHCSPKRSSSLDQVPATDSQSEVIQESSVTNEGSTHVENEPSGVSAQSASQDAKKESTAETEENSSKGRMSLSFYVIFVVNIFVTRSLFSF